MKLTGINAIPHCHNLVYINDKKVTSAIKNIDLNKIETKGEN